MTNFGEIFYSSISPNISSPIIYRFMVCCNVGAGGWVIVLALLLGGESWCWGMSDCSCSVTGRRVMVLGDEWLFLLCYWEESHGAGGWVIVLALLLGGESWCWGMSDCSCFVTGRRVRRPCLIPVNLTVYTVYMVKTKFPHSRSGITTVLRLVTTSEMVGSHDQFVEESLSIGKGRKQPWAVLESPRRAP